jgi:hypothetical protein
MATIEVISASSWTLFRAKGDLSRDDIITAITTHLPDASSPHIIWDLLDASMHSMTQADFTAIAETSKSHNQTRGDAKTAFVGTTQETFALVCMYTGLASLDEISIEYAAFSSIEEAERWIEQPE